ncbi:MAG: SurA N-terminal domain-containing protein [Pseudomonadota bacterium]
MTRTTFRSAGYAMGLGAALVVGGALLPTPTGPWSAGPALSQSVYTAVLVNDAPITNYEIDARAALLRLQGAPGGRASAQAEEELIDESLQRAEARRIGIGVSATELDAAIARIVQNTGLTGAQFRQALGQNGVDMGTFRDSIEAQLLWSDVIEARFRATVRVEEQDVIAALGDRTSADSSEQTATEYTLQEVLFITQEGADQGTIQRRLREANAFRSQFDNCSTGLQRARQLTEVVVRDEVRRFSSDLDPQIDQVLSETPVGRLTTPEASPTGVTMFAVCNKREVRSDADARRDIEDELRQEEGALLSRGYLRDLRASATIIRPER